MRIILIIFFSLVYQFNQIEAQDAAFRLEKKIKGDFVTFSVDNLENIYLINAADQLKKLNSNGDSVAVFNNVRKFGKIAQLDVSNPLRVLLYYKDFSTVVMLDRLLNIRTTIDLRKQEIFQVQAIGLSYDNKIWLYDEFEHKLKKIDEDGKLLFATADFRQLFDEAFSFSSVSDEGGLLYLYDKSRGVYAFDYYGTLKNIISLTDYENFRVTGKYISGTRHDTLMRYQPSSFNLQQVQLPDTFQKADKILFTANKAYALRKDELEIYQIR